MNALVAYWQGISPREQTMVAGIGGFSVLVILYLLVINPLVTRFDEATQQLKIEKELSTWVSNHSSQLKALRSQNGSAANTSLPLNQVVTNSVRRFNLEIERLQPQQKDLQVWLKPMPFDSLVRWLEQLSQTSAVKVKFIELAGSETPGVVEVKRLQLGRE